MSQDSNPPLILRGRLLLAGMELLEPTFRRTVIVIVEHSREEGALGYVLNRPLRQRVADLLPAPEFAPVADVPVYFGGPVGQEHLTFVSLSWDAAGRSLVCRTHLSPAQTQASLAEGFEVRGFVGYSGWSPGQLEGELAARAWEVQTADPDEVLAPRSADLWSRLARKLGPLHRIAADMPDDLSLN